MKLTITRVLEISKVLAGDVGKAIPEFFEYMAEFVDQVVRALRNGLSFKDNFDCQVKTVSLRHNTPQIISTDRTVQGVIVMRLGAQDITLDSFGWYYDDNNRLTFKAAFDPDPARSIDVLVVIMF